MSKGFARYIRVLSLQIGVCGMIPNHTANNQSAHREDVSKRRSFNNDIKKTCRFDAFTKRLYVN